jgi:hypothetical protein
MVDPGAIAPGAQNWENAPHFLNFGPEALRQGGPDLPKRVHNLYYLPCSITFPRVVAFHPFALCPTDTKEAPSRYQRLAVNDSLCMLQHALPMCMLSITHTSRSRAAVFSIISLSLSLPPTHSCPSCTVFNSD